MNTANNHLRRDTENRIKEALFFFTSQGNEPTVAEICRRAEINRSTFYRHYIDINDLMEKAEADIQKGLLQSLGEAVPPNSTEFLLPFLHYIEQNKSFYIAYLGSHIGKPMESGFNFLWDKYLIPMFRSHGVTNERHMLYYYDYARSGFMAVLMRWLESGCAESCEEIAYMLSQLLSRAEKR